jgi:hypothetical protein
VRSSVPRGISLASGSSSVGPRFPICTIECDANGRR